MATVHPSRMGLVPQDSKDHGRSRYRSRSHPRSPERSNGAHSRERHGGRKSPEYDAYRAPPAALPWRVEENMYPPRGGGGGRPSNGGWNGGDSLSSRQHQRESRTVNIWPPSPKGHSRELSPARGSKKRSRKRERSPSVSSSESSSSEEERRRRERKERRRAREKKEKEERREKKRSNRHRKSDDEEDRRDSRRSRGRSEDRRRTTRSVSRRRSPDDEDQWVEKETSSKGFIPLVPTTSTSIEATQVPVSADDPDFDVEVGPQPLTAQSTSKVDERSYGGALLRGEGSAMAAFLADDVNARIPRRGEIGLTSDEIATYESVGYVMSGSRHRRMNAVRMRKENQVISAEEKRGILKLQKEERERREEVLREEFKELVDERLKAAGKTPK